jgi:predicted DNA-binding protein
MNMSAQLTVTLPDNVYQRAKRLAELTGRDVTDVISEKLTALLPPLSSEMDMRPIESLSDEAIERLADGQMDVALSSRMSTLQYKQQAGTISDDERAELKLLMELYDVGQLQKTQALVEAIKRGLRQRLDSCFRSNS